MPAFECRQYGIGQHGVRRFVGSAIDLLAREGARCEDVELPRVDELRETQAVVIGTEAGAYHRERLGTFLRGML